MSNLSEGGAVLGSIEVKSNQLVVTANSRQRAERAKAMIGAALAGLIAVPTLEAATPEEVLEKDEPTTEPSAEDARFVAIAPDVKRRIIHCQLDEHYRKNSRQATCHFGRNDSAASRPSNRRRPRQGYGVAQISGKPIA